MNSPMDLIDNPSPNFGERPANTAIDMVVLHYTGMTSGNTALDRMCDPAAQVSAHYMIDEDGTVYRLVAEEKRAWHAGVAHWSGATDINDRSVGIEIVNPGHEFGYRPFPDAQMSALETLLRGILGRHNIPTRRVVGHSDIAPARKQDPGELFDWKRLASQGLAIWPERKLPPVDTDSAFALLTQIGYDPAADAVDVVTAFQRRFAPDCVTGQLDNETLAMIASVHAING